MIRLIATDLDGTLLNAQHMMDPTILHNMDQVHILVSDQSLKL